MERLAEPVYAFGPFTVDTKTRSLTREGRPVALTAKAFDLLQALLERRGGVVTKDALMRVVWPDAVVSDNSLAVNVWTLRRALGEAPGGRPYVLTVPGRGYRFVADVSEQGPEGSSEGIPRSLAVLPFETLGPGPHDPYLEVGLADALTTRLSSLRALRVRPTSAVAPFHRSHREPLAIGRELEVEAVITGAIQRRRARARISVQLVRCADGAALWGERFDEPWGDVFRLEDSLAEKVAAALSPRLSGRERRGVSRRPTESGAAYAAYLKGRYFWNRRTAEALRSAQAHFNEAIRLDPGFALAWVGLADCYNVLCVYSAVPAAEGWMKAKAAAQRALEIDDGLAPAHTSLGCASIYGWDWRTAERELLRGLEQDPQYPTAHHWWADFCAAQGRLEEAVASMRRALELDPLSLMLATTLAEMLLYAGQLDEAEAHLTGALQMDPHFAQANQTLAWVHAERGGYAEAVRCLEHAHDPGDPYLPASLGYLLGRAGRRAEAERCLDDLLRFARKAYLPADAVAMVHLGLGHRDRALEWLRRAVEERTSVIVYLGVIPYFRRLHGAPGFAGLLRAIGLPARPWAEAPGRRTRVKAAPGRAAPLVRGPWSKTRRA